jgi:hypothetical protein
MTERLHEKKGHLRLTVELEVNDELMDVVRDAVSKASTRLPELMRRGGTEKTSSSKEPC